MLIADTATEIASLLLVRDIKKWNVNREVDRRGRRDGNKSAGVWTLCWGKLVKDYRLKSPLFLAFIWYLFIHICEAPVYSFSDQVPPHTYMQI